MATITVTLDRSSKSVPIAIGTPAAHFGRIDYSGFATAADAQHRGYQTMVLEYSSSVAAKIAAIKAALPNVKVFMYARFVVNTTDAGGWINGVPSNFTTDPTWGGLNHSWFVINPATGTPLSASGYIFLDVTQATLQQAIISHVASQAKSAGFDGVFWDGVDTVLGLGALKAQPSSPTAWAQTNANYVAGMTAFLTAMRAGLRAQGLLHIGNIGGAWQNSTQAGLWRTWGALLDGALEEGFAFAGDSARTPLSAAQLAQQVANIAWSEANGKLTLLNCYKTDAASNTYALAAALLAANGLTAYNVSNGQYGNGFELWLAAYDTAVALGAGAPYTAGAWARSFAGGAVSVSVSALTGAITLA